MTARYATPSLRTLRSTRYPATALIVTLAALLAGCASSGGSASTSTVTATAADSATHGSPAPAVSSTYPQTSTASTSAGATSSAASLPGEPDGPLGPLIADHCPDASEVAQRFDGIDGDGTGIGAWCAYGNSGDPSQTVRIDAHGAIDSNGVGFNSIAERRATIAAQPTISAIHDEPLFGTGAFSYDNGPAIKQFGNQIPNQCALVVPAAGQVNGFGQPFTLFEIIAGSDTLDIDSLCRGVRELGVLLY